MAGDLTLGVDEFAAFHGPVHQIFPEVAGQIAVIGGVQYEEVGPFPRFE
jgi:hypothetical protein